MSPSSTSSTSSSSNSTSGVFTGSSAYSTDFQNVITRAVQIASLPITLLDNDKTNVSNQSTELQTLDSKFSALQTAIGGISDALDGSSYTADIADTSVLSATVSAGASEGYYTVEVKDTGAYPTSLTTGSWNGQSGATDTYTLSIGSTDYSLTPTDNSAAAVAAAINSNYGDKVRATVVNVGSSSSPDYRISLQGVSLADNALDIKDNGTSLQTQQTVGRPAQYIVDGSGGVVTSASRNVTIASGLTVNLLSTSDSAVGITVTRSTAALSNALSSFATAYNDAANELASQRGQTGGALQGQSIVNQLTSTLSGIATYFSSGGGVGSLSDLGLSLGSDGKLTFNSFGLIAADISNSSAVNSFLGTTTGSGFLKYATDALNGVEDASTGILKTTESDLTNQINNLTNQISTKQDQVDRLRDRLISQMSAADAMIASLEQQYSYLSSVFSAMQTADRRYTG